MKTILIDPERCMQCCNCQNACKDEHCDNDWSPITREQGRHQFWIQVRETEVGSGTRMKLNRVSVPCQHCADAPCMAVAGEAMYRREEGYVLIDPAKAKGLRELVQACPYGAIYYNEELDLPQKCTMCAHLLDMGRDLPRCVAACPSDALRFVDTSELTVDNMYAPLERLNPEFGTNPQVAYVNLPKPFIAGAVYDPKADQCLEDVKVKATHMVTGKVFKTRTDNYGEFRLWKLDPGFYTVAFYLEGYRYVELSKIDARTCPNLEDIKLYPRVN
ncbi:MAG: carboxypeptidase regulatory-like domain-containing protein [Coriobacteriales bacterium]|jgi:Fe-S-cluster-containing dehydrogenase component|nr:carboxypeptidase regulatory-like domain-containing protein [Coriobacteriales bacterium]